MSKLTNVWGYPLYFCLALEVKKKRGSEFKPFWKIVVTYTHRGSKRLEMFQTEKSVC